MTSPVEVGGFKVWEFLSPHLNEPLQIVLLAIILTLIAYTVIGVQMRARPASWERKWNHGTPDDPTDDLDVEHGTVTDLSEAVATAEEKLAEIMPGLLLVVGLLGTFVGLGLALNDAGKALSNASEAVRRSGNNGINFNPIDSLTPMLVNLGTKFKTSAWGIIGFLLLKIWSQLVRFDERRLTWVIDKVKVELERRKRIQNATEAARWKELGKTIRAAAQESVAGISTGVARLIGDAGERQTQFIHQLHLEGDFTRDILERICAETQGTNAAMAHFVGSTQRIIANMDGAAQQMAVGAGEVGRASKDLVGAVSAFRIQFTAVLESVRTDLGSAIRDLSERAADTFERGSNELRDATREIGRALGQLSSDVQGTMAEVKNSIGKALEIQQRAALEFIQSSDSLNHNITVTTETVGKLARPIADGLESVANSGMHMHAIGKVLQMAVESSDKVVAELKEQPSVVSKVATELHKLSLALGSLATVAAGQEKVLGALQPLDVIQANQGRLLGEIRGLRGDLRGVVPGAPPENSTGS